MPTRTSRTAWDGGLQDGSGQVEFSSSRLGTFTVSFPKRAADEDDGTVTTPEELLAASHSSCYAMALAGQIGAAGGTPISHEVTAEVSLGADPDGGFKITSIHLTVRAEVEGLDADGFRVAAENAKAGCPISKALAATPITLDAALETA
jgi:osmotically inducible protein OsmC